MDKYEIWQRIMEAAGYEYTWGYYDDDDDELILWDRWFIDSYSHELDLHGYQLRFLPPEIGLFINLPALDLSNNQLTSLPPEIGKLTNLTTLNLSGNQLRFLPPEIGLFINLPALDLSNNQLTSLPPEIGKLTNLTTLNLSSNQLTSLPPEIGELTNLITLDLSNNQLTPLPSEIVKLTNLTTLNLSNNQLTSLPPEIVKLTSLTTLYLSNNQLTSLPPEIVKLANLKELYLSNNQLTSLPPEIVKLTSLTTLYLSSNQLTALPPEIVKLTNLSRLYLSANPLEKPPPEITIHGIEAIFEYLQQLPEEAIEHNEAKMILVGEGDVGKTCLAKRLIFDEFIEDKRTQGIDILDWRFTAPTPDKEEVKLNVWDFGGQEIYHATHQFFLTKRSLYLLVWNARKLMDYEKHNEPIYYWLHTIEAFGGDSPIILVMSKLNEQNDDLDMKELREKFPKIVDLYKVDSEDGKGIPALKDIISETVWYLPHMRTPWVESWYKVRERLEQDGRDWIEYTEFKQICRSEGLDNKQTDILDKYLHDLGVIIHFRDRLELRNMVILKPEWATKAIYKVLDTQSVIDRDGILLHRELDQIRDSNIYPLDIFPKLLELMNKFELAYELPDRESHLVAERLPKEKPEFEWEDTENLRFYYHYDFLPAGVITRFIVRVHQDLEDKLDGTHLCWRKGAVLQREGTRALVTVEPSEKRIEINIYGSRKRELLAIIRNHFDHINSSIKKVKITKEIPCNCSSDCPYIFNYEQLLIAEKKGKVNVDCQESWKEVPLSLLLDGYKKKEDRMKETDEILKGKGIPTKVEISPYIEVKPVMIQKAEAKAETNIEINLNVDLPVIKTDFGDLKGTIAHLDPELKEELDKLEDSLDEVSVNTEKEKLVKPFNKLDRFLQKLEDENSKYHKIVKGTKKGIERAQKLGKTYNKFAQWLALPQVPDLFLGK